MLKTKLLHPQILHALAGCGHFSRVLVADGNYPVATMSLPQTPRVFLNLMPDVPTVTQVLEALVTAVPLQEALLVSPPEESLRAAAREYAGVLPQDLPRREVAREEFYAAVKSSDTGLIIATADTRRFANILLTVGVVRDFPGR